MLMFNVVYSKLSFGNPIVPLIKIHFRPSLQPSRSSLILYSSFLWWRFGTRYHPTTWLISYIYLQFTCAEVAQQKPYLISAYTIIQCCGKLYAAHLQVLHFPWSLLVYCSSVFGQKTVPLHIGVDDRLDLHQHNYLCVVRSCANVWATKFTKFTKKTFSQEVRLLACSYKAISSSRIKQSYYCSGLRR